MFLFLSRDSVGDERGRSDAFNERRDDLGRSCTQQGISCCRGRLRFASTVPSERGGQEPNRVKGGWRTRCNGRVHGSGSFRHPFSPTFRLSVSTRVTQQHNPPDQSVQLDRNSFHYSFRAHTHRRESDTSRGFRLFELSSQNFSPLFRFFFSFLSFFFFRSFFRPRRLFLLVLVLALVLVLVCVCPLPQRVSDGAPLSPVSRRRDRVVSSASFSDARRATTAAEPPTTTHLCLRLLIRGCAASVFRRVMRLCAAEPDDSARPAATPRRVRLPFRCTLCSRAPRLSLARLSFPVSLRFRAHAQVSFERIFQLWPTFSFSFFFLSLLPSPLFFLQW